MKEQGDRLKAFREYKGYSRIEFADACNVTPGTISHWEKGRHELGKKLLKVITAFPDLNLSWIETGEGSMVEDTKGNHKLKLVLEENDRLKKELKLLQQLVDLYKPKR